MRWFGDGARGRVADAGRRAVGGGRKPGPFFQEGPKGGVDVGRLAVLIELQQVALAQQQASGFRVLDAGFSRGALNGPVQLAILVLLLGQAQLGFQALGALGEALLEAAAGDAGAVEAPAQDEG